MTGAPIPLEDLTEGPRDHLVRCPKDHPIALHILSEDCHAFYNVAWLPTLNVFFVKFLTPAYVTGEVKVSMLKVSVGTTVVIVDVNRLDDRKEVVTKVGRQYFTVGRSQYKLDTGRIHDAYGHYRRLLLLQAQGRLAIQVAESRPEAFLREY